MKLSDSAVTRLAWFAAAAILFWGLGSVPLTDVDEGAFSEATREMLERGDFVSPWLLDSPRFDKPVLIHWLQMVTMGILGANPWGARLPSAIAGLFWVGAIAAWAAAIAQQIRLSINVHRVFACTLIIAVTSVGIPVIARSATADALLNALLAWSLLFCWRALFVQTEAEAVRMGRWAALCVGLGLLTKGPVALLVPAASFAMAALLLGGHGLRRMKSMALDPWSWMLVVAVTAPWYALQYRAQGMAFVEGFLGLHNLGRFTQTMHDFAGGPWYYPAWMVVAVMPWAPLLVRTVWRVFADSRLRNPALYLAISNVVFVMVFFSFSATKLPHYGFYGLSGLMVVMGIAWVASHPARRWSRFHLLDQRLFLAILLGGLASLPLWVEQIAPSVKNPYFAAVFSAFAQSVLQSSTWFVLPLIAAAVVLIAPIFAALSVGSVAFTLMLHGLVVGPAIEANRGPIRALAQVIVEQGITVSTWRLSSPSLSFEARRVIKPADPEPGAVVVLYAKDLPSLAKRFEQLHGRQMQHRLIWEKTGVQMIAIG